MATFGNPMNNSNWNVNDKHVLPRVTLHLKWIIYLRVCNVCIEYWLLPTAPQHDIDIDQRS